MELFNINGNIITKNKMLRLTNKTQAELKMYMHSLHYIIEDCKYVYWSGGILNPTHRTEWWVILDYNNLYRFVEFKKDNTTKEIKESYNYTSQSFMDIMTRMKFHSKDGYILLKNETVIV